MKMFSRQQTSNIKVFCPHVSIGVFNIATEKLPFPKSKVVFQSSCFRGELNEPPRSSLTWLAGNSTMNHESVNVFPIEKGDIPMSSYFFRGVNFGSPAIPKGQKKSLFARFFNANNKPRCLLTRQDMHTIFLRGRVFSVKRKIPIKVSVVWTLDILILWCFIAGLLSYVTWHLHVLLCNVNHRASLWVCQRQRCATDLFHLPRYVLLRAGCWRLFRHPKRAHTNKKRTKTAVTSDKKTKKSKKSNKQPQKKSLIQKLEFPSHLYMIFEKKNSSHPHGTPVKSDGAMMLMADPWRKLGKAAETIDVHGNLRDPDPNAC